MSLFAALRSVVDRARASRGRAPVTEPTTVVPITGVWLRTVGGDENGVGARLEVLLEMPDGAWRRVIETVQDQFISHIVEPLGIAQADVVPDPGVPTVRFRGFARMHADRPRAPVVSSISPDATADDDVDR